MHWTINKIILFRLFRWGESLFLQKNISEKRKGALNFTGVKQGSHVEG